MDPRGDVGRARHPGLERGLDAGDHLPRLGDELARDHLELVVAADDDQRSAGVGPKRLPRPLHPRGENGRLRDLVELAGDRGAAGVELALRPLEHHRERDALAEAIDEDVGRLLGRGPLDHERGAVEAVLDPEPREREQHDAGEPDREGRLRVIDCCAR
jgi:hypothetical protein